jgi:RNA polymerase sigma factor (sigma-70 family)
MFSTHDETPDDACKRQFATTQWSVVLAAGGSDNSDGRDALAQLCESYWYPLYAYVRRRVNNVDDAQDLTQGFFAYLLDKQTIAKADCDRGRFRAFLLTALKNFLTNEAEKARTEKRGGGRPVLSLDFDSGESRYSIEPFHQLTPECIFERGWVLALLKQVLDRLQLELIEAGKAKHFELLKDTLTEEANADDYERSAQALGMTSAAVKQTAYRMRKRYRQLFREEVAQTVAHENEIEDEIGHLLQALDV